MIREGAGGIRIMGIRIMGGSGRGNKLVKLIIYRGKDIKFGAHCRDTADQFLQKTDALFEMTDTLLLHICSVQFVSGEAGVAKEAMVSVGVGKRHHLLGR